MHLIVVIPALNEEKRIGGVISRVPRKIKGIDKVSVLIVDDGSQDKTVPVSKKAGADFVVSHSKNMGLGAAMKTAINFCLEKNADIMVNIDADGQLFPEDIPSVIKPIIEDKADFVTASRFISGKKIKNIPPAKKAGNALLAKFISWAIKKKIYDVACGFRAYSRETLLNLNLFGKYTYTQEMFLDLSAKDLRISEVPVRVKYFKNRESRIASSLFKYGWQVFKIILRAFRDYQPLRFFGFGGLLLFTPGFIIGLILLIRWIDIHRITPYLSLVYISMIFMIVGFLLIILALIADMLYRIRLNQEKILYFEKKKNYQK